MPIIQIARNAVIAKLINPPPSAVSFVNTLLSYEVEASTMGGWAGKSSFFDIATNTFPAGFAHLAQENLAQSGYTVQIVAKPPALPLGEANPIVDDFGNEDPRYDYQMRALRQVEKHGAGIIRVATGGGKSKIAKLIMRRYNRMTLFITTRGILLYQMKDQIDAMGIETGVVGDGEMRFVRGVNMGMVQTLVQAIEMPSLDGEVRAIVKSIHLSKTKDSTISREEILKIATPKYEMKVKRRNAILKFLSLIEVVIGEEAHEAGGNSYYEILRHCKNATIRIALTATPFMRSSAADNMRLMAAFGPILIDIPESLLIERGILAKPYFKLQNSLPHPKLHRSSPFERAYDLGYINNPNMHRDICLDARKAAERRLPILTLVSRVKHGDELLKAYEAAGLRFEFLKGADDMRERRKQIDRMLAGEIDGIIGTTIMDVGVDIPAIGLVQLAGGMKAEVSLRQRIGRGLRAKRIGTNATFIADYSCNMNMVLRDHARTREAIIRGTAGFLEGVLNDGDDFPWHLFPVVNSRKAA